MGNINQAIDFPQYSIIVIALFLKKIPSATRWKKKEEEKGEDQCNRWGKKKNTEPPYVPRRTLGARTKALGIRHAQQATKQTTYKTKNNNNVQPQPHARRKRNNNKAAVIITTPIIKHDGIR